MEIIKIIGIGLISLFLLIILRQYRPEFSVYISIIAGILILYISFSKLGSIINLIDNLSNKAAINSEFLKVLIKITGIAILSEFAVSICKDSGEVAIANKIDLGGKIIIISMSVPIISSLLETIMKILP